jgi:hypothetical protein
MAKGSIAALMEQDQQVNKATVQTNRQTYHVPDDAHRALKILAAEQGTTVSALAVEAIRELLKKHGK